MSTEPNQKAGHMKGKVDRIVMDELIGLDVEVIKSSRRELIGLKGVIVDETLNTLKIEAGGREILVPKAVCIFRLKTKGGSADVDGRDILFRPEDRIKKYWKNFSPKKSSKR